jgi:neurotransmitter:Na+ symporter, NSS family
VIAAIGAAVGLGNVWRFSYVAGENGGATFLLVYLAAIFVLGIPLVIAEVAVGRHSKADAVESYRVISRNPLWIAPGGSACCRAS